ncbi:MAG TPA: DUF3891 family protein [Solirubrobacteraceae bacterium]
MLVRREDEEGALAIGQLSHAWLSGQLARAWGNEEFPAPEPREAVSLGAEQHDVGWALFDLRPGLSTDSGLPRSFLELTPQEHLSIWRTAPDRLLSVSAHAALVVSLHGASLSQLRVVGSQEGVADLQAHIADERRRQERLREQLGISEEQTQRIQRQMWTWDGLSLALCSGWDPFTARDVPARTGLVDLELRSAGRDGEFALEPWPFTLPRVELRCEGKRLAPHYDDEEAMQRALDEAEPVTLAFVLAA